MLLPSEVQKSSFYLFRIIFKKMKESCGQRRYLLRRSLTCNVAGTFSSESVLERMSDLWKSSFTK